jgi:hypothetical protein
MPSAVARLQENILKAPPPASSRADVLTRYRHLREVSKRHNDKILKLLSGDAVLRHARRLGLAFGREIVLDSPDELNYAFDLAIHTAPPGRSRAIDRYARTAEFPRGSDEGLVLGAMRNARFALIHIERRHEVAGLVVTDLLRRKELWLVDEGMERSFSNLELVATRLYTPESFAMTAGVLVPFDMEFLEDVFCEVPQLGGKRLEEAADDRRLAEAIYRIAIESGVTEIVRYQDPAGAVE